MMLEVFSVRPPHWYIGISLWSDATHAIYTCMQTTNNKYYYTFCIIFPNRNKEQFYPFFLSQIKKVQLFKVDTLQFSDTFKPIICSNNYVINTFLLLLYLPFNLRISPFCNFLLLSSSSKRSVYN